MLDLKALDLVSIDPTVELAALPGCIAIGCKTVWAGVL
jgi:hypothetical protein